VHVHSKGMVVLFEVGTRKTRTLINECRAVLFVRGLVFHCSHGHTATLATFNSTVDSAC
jgi:hypothetical protein